MAVSQNLVVTTQSIKTAQKTCTAAKTTYADAVAATLLLTGGANGSIIYKVTGLPKGTTGGAGRLLLFSSLDGTTLSLIGTANFADYTQSVSSGPVQTDIGYSETSPRRVAALEQIWVATSIAPTAGFAVDAQFEDL